MPSYYLHLTYLPAQFNLAEAVPGDEEDYPCSTCELRSFAKSVKDYMWCGHGGGPYRSSRDASICGRGSGLLHSILLRTFRIR